MSITQFTNERQSTDYQRFLERKRMTVKASGFEVDAADISDVLFPFQRDIVRWALKLGKAALFEECGLGKTAQQLEWARHVVAYTGGRVLILAPLAVAHQTVREGEKFGVPVTYAKTGDEATDATIVITNYERLDKFSADDFVGVVLDESSILKAFTGKTKRAIIEAFRATPYKLACTATPAPNDHLELGNHADFLDIMPSNEMISRWFINDTMTAGNYRLKKHAAADFWRWLTSWAVCLSNPGDLGSQYDMPGFALPPLSLIEHLVPLSAATLERTREEGRLIPDDSPSSTQLQKVKRESLDWRVAQSAEIVSALPDDEPVVIWCDTNFEADALKAAFPDALEVRGSDKLEWKEEALSAFTDGKCLRLITKPDIAGFGLNWQHCAHQVFVGVSYSFEKTYQALRRSYRFGQTKPVHGHLIYAETEGNVLATLRAKQDAFEMMQQEMNAAMAEHGLFRDDSRLALTVPAHEVVSGEGWALHLGDCIPVVSGFEADSIDYGIHSPPFSNLYIYSDSEADMGNTADDDEFFAQYEFLIEQLYRVTKPGRLHSVHCKDLPLYMNRDGSAGLRDFPGDIIRAFERHGWTFHSRVTIWKDPVIEMQRTKNHGLLHKNFTERAEACRQGMADYLLTFRKWPIEGGVSVKQSREVGDYIGTEPPTVHVGGHRNVNTDYSIQVWQRYASPVWFDIDQTNVLNYQIARGNQDEKHICPLQLDVIARSIDLWTNPGDLVLDPFNGIGSAGVEALKLGRRYVGVELKRSYFDMAHKNLVEAERKAGMPDLFQWAASQS